MAAAAARRFTPTRTPCAASQDAAAAAAAAQPKQQPYKTPIYAACVLERLPVRVVFRCVSVAKRAAATCSPTTPARCLPHCCCPTAARQRSLKRLLHPTTQILKSPPPAWEAGYKAWVQLQLSAEGLLKQYPHQDAKQREASNKVRECTSKAPD
jgi:hypothetical protein